MCILLHLYTPARTGQALLAAVSVSSKSLSINHLLEGVIEITAAACFGAGNALVIGNKEAANSKSMTTLFDSPCHFPKIHSGWRIGIFFRLS